MLAKVSKAFAAALAGFAAYVVAALTNGGAHLSVGLVVAGLVAALVAGLATWAVPNKAASL